MRTFLRRVLAPGCPPNIANRARGELLILPESAIRHTQVGVGHGSVGARSSVRAVIVSRHVICRPRLNRVFEPPPEVSGALLHRARFR